ncbi:response regulator [Syntrophotalea carbinolica DSM 2380]|uniref:Response regulator n=1 Tax=Syntrophotalea carbinolica (strain DSM 2380 / NBRC 103641 / GraBd1) TaxID=338963 RepID=Q3A5A1_SYNC1|nr:hypothetical protein [Syntrophotalea carbinolica]ABA88456.1 response regulator [Syntrophotalea carbinolica DSM 2380]
MSDKQRITDIFSTLAEKLASGLGDLLGCSIEVSLASEQLVSKAQFFGGFRKKLVLANFDVTGSREGRMYCSCHLKDAVLLGGTLIMLPPAELEKQVRNEVFSEDEADAYGEIVNIVSGELIQAFDEAAVDKLHFKKTGMDVVVPAKVDPEGPEPFGPGNIYHVAYDITLDGQTLQSMDMLFPPELLGMVIEEPEQAASAGAVTPAVDETPPPVQSAAREAESAVEESSGNTILVIAGRKQDVHDLTDGCIAEGFVPKVASYQDDLQPFGPNGSFPASGVVLTMDEGKEQGLAAIIKAKSIVGESVPLVAAGGQWTRSQVLQAVKYGVCDILVMPATPDDIREKLRQNLASSRK